MSSEYKTVVPHVVAGHTEYKGGVTQHHDIDGLWVGDQKSQIGLIKESGVGVYLALYDDLQAHEYPVAFSSKGVQLSHPHRGHQEYRFVSWDDLFALVKAWKSGAFGPHCDRPGCPADAHACPSQCPAAQAEAVAGAVVDAVNAVAPKVRALIDGSPDPA